MLLSEKESNSLYNTPTHTGSGKYKLKDPHPTFSLILEVQPSTALYNKNLHCLFPIARPNALPIPKQQKKLFGYGLIYLSCYLTEKNQTSSSYMAKTNVLSLLQTTFNFT